MRRAGKAMAKACIYCGNVAQGVDHVPPECLFQRPLPGDMVTVPSCAKCNKRFGLDDEYFRDALALSTYESANPPARAILERSRDGWAQHQSTIAERVKLLPIDMKRIGRTAERVIHGLHFHHTGRVLPAGYEPKVIHGQRMPTVARLDLPFFERLFAPLHQAPWHS